MTGALIMAVTLAVLVAAGGPTITLAQDPTPPLSSPAGMAPPMVGVPAVIEPVEQPGAALPDPLSLPEEGPVSAQDLALPPPAHDLSPMGMFHAADPVVKGVMILLVVASIATWTVLLVRGLGLFISKIRLKRALRKIRGAGGLDEASARVTKGVGGRLLHEAAEEARLSQGLPNDGVKERVHIALSRLETEIGRRMAFGTGLLATVGSVGPFVGLFGTVWGIMRSFIGIANSNTTNLAVVAPGIAEALLATGIGLVAAIPAVVIYNALVRSVASYRVLMGDTVALILRHLSRDLDRHGSGSTGRVSDTVRLAAE